MLHSNTPIIKHNTLMRLADVSVKQKRKFKITTDSKHKLPVAPNVLACNFTVLIVHIFGLQKVGCSWQLS